MACKHKIIRNDHCMQCGELIFTTESRPCSECVHFKYCKDGWVSCNKHKVTITRNMHVWYKIKEGTCFIKRKENS